uniref:CUB domain-containing protein n=1 Tax=Panagrolaimus davidi TaxID=227884 RepID=A0A914PC73_9BILA
MYLEINLSKGNPDFMTTMEFRAYISIVKKNIEKNTANCILSTENSYKYWSLNFDTGHVNGIGYGNNEYCSYTLVIPQNRTYVAEILILSLESSSDYLKYYYDNEEGTIVTDVISLIFDPFTNGSDRLVKWEFVSDGSLPALGFYIGFREIGKI